MFGLVSSLTKAVVETAVLPVKVAADVVTLGGSLNDKREPYTVSSVKKIMGHLDDATD